MSMIKFKTNRTVLRTNENSELILYQGIVEKIKKKISFKMKSGSFHSHTTRSP